MTRTNLIPLLAAAMMVAFAVASTAQAAINLNSSRSNIYKTAADCTKAGGKWQKGGEGLGCYLPAKAGDNSKPK